MHCLTLRWRWTIILPTIVLATVTLTLYYSAIPNLHILLENIQQYSEFGSELEISRKPQRTYQHVFSWNRLSNCSFQEKTNSTEASTIAKFSTAEILGGKKVFSMNEDIRVLVRVCDGRRKRKSHGGDFFRAWLTRENNSKFASAGRVEDRGDGTYLVNFKAFWPGSVLLHVMLVYSSEAVCAIQRVVASLNEGDMVKYKARFTRGGLTEERSCDTAPLRKHRGNVCNLTERNDGVPFYCQAPTNSILRCEDWIMLLNDGTDERLFDLLTSAEKQLLGFVEDFVKNEILPVTKVTIKEPEGALRKTSLPPCHEVDADTVMRSLPPVGYYTNGTWTSVACLKTSTVSTLNFYRNCLRNTTLHFIGDSTVRQYITQLTKFMGMEKPGGCSSTCHSRDKNLNFTVFWYKHGAPFRGKGDHHLVKDMKHIHKFLDKTQGGTREKIVMTYGPHVLGRLGYFYRDEMEKIRAAAERLKKRSPDTFLAFKGMSTMHCNKKILGGGRHRLSCSFTLNEFHVSLYNDIAREALAGSGVVWLDSWDMTVCHQSPGYIHPKSAVVTNYLDTLMAFMCPA